MADFSIKNDYSKDSIVIECFDKIIISCYRDDKRKCCAECIKNRFINTRKDRVEISKSNDCEVSEIYKPLIKGLITVISSEKELIDNYGRRKVFLFDKNDFSIKAEYVTAVPDCDVCSTLPEDSEELSDSVGLQLIDKIYGADNIPFRSEDCVDIAKRIEIIALNKDFGAITTILDNYDSPFPIAVAMLPISSGQDEPGTGRTSSIEKSRAIALLEAYERYAGFTPKSKEVNCFKSLNEIKAEKLNVISLDKLILNQDTVPNEFTYGKKKFVFLPDKKYHWVYGYDITEKKSLLIPESLAYYGIKLKGEEYRYELIAYEVSNGCSVGSNIEEAVYNGFLEVIERDAFLTCWYMDREITRIILDDEFYSTKSKLHTEIKQFNSFYNDYKLDIYEISLSCHIPVVLLTVTRKETDKTKMNFMCAAAADENIYEAVRKALHEISSIFIGLQEKFQESLESIAIKGNDFSLIKNMDDHSLVWGYYKNLDMITFADQVKKTIRISDWNKEHMEYESLNSSFAAAVNELSDQEKHVVFVDQTTEEMKQISMSCAKVFVPGLIPMTFGADNIRISNERIKEVEKAEGRKVKIRFTPHPFP